MPQTLVPMFSVSPRVGEGTVVWWREIGRSLVSFTEIEQLAIDWAVCFSGNRALWKIHFMDDLKRVAQVLRRTIKQAGSHRLSAATRTEMLEIFSKLESLIQQRNDIAHMRLRFSHVPTNDDDWIPSASHVEVRKRKGNDIVLARRSLQWIRDVTDDARRIAGEFQSVMQKVAVEIHSANSSKS